MALTQVTRHTSTGLLLALCSCGWQGEPQAVKSEAYRDRNRHQREHAGDGEQSTGETVNDAPAGESPKPLDTYR